MKFNDVDFSKLSAEAQNVVVESEKQKVNLGWLGSLFGCMEQAQFNIVGFLVISTVLMLVAYFIFLWTGKENQAFGAGLFAIVNTSLGYMFGKKT